MPGLPSGTRCEAPPSEVRFDPMRSPASVLPPGMLRADRQRGTGPWSHDADSYDAAMLLLTASDNEVSDRLAGFRVAVPVERLTVAIFVHAISQFRV